MRGAVAPDLPAAPPSPSATGRGRIDALDAARGIALLAMALYHLSWDLRWFSLVDWPVDSSPGWRGFAAAIAGCFLGLVGIGLVLAHGHGIRWRKALARSGRIALAAAAISLGTWLALGDQYVRFGILHAIAAGSLIALPAVLLPPLVTLGLAALVLALPHLVTLSFTGDGWFAWTGLVGHAPPSVDHVPLAPWLGVILAGVALARFALPTRPFARIAAWRAGNGATRLAVLAGRHSLAVYLLHQPVLFGTVWTLVQLGLAPDPARGAFLEQCTMACALADPSAEAHCAASCRCTLDRLVADGTWRRLTETPDDADALAAMNGAYRQCRRAAGPPGR